MEQYIQPKFDSFDIVTSWGDTDDLWAKELSINISNVENRTNSEVGEVFYIVVCSPKFHDQPNEEVSAEDLDKAIVMDTFSDEAVKKALRNKIDNLGKITINDFEAKFRSMFGMTDWDQ